MVLAPTRQTFLEMLVARHDAFRPIEESGARLIGHEMDTIKQEALGVIQAGMADHVVEGAYVPTAAAIQRAEGVVREIDELYGAGLGTVDSKLISIKEGAFQTAGSDISIASTQLPGGPQAGLGVSFTQAFPEAAQAAVERPVLGISAASKWNGVHKGTVENVQKTLVSAVLSGESEEATIAKLAEGLDISRASAQRIARTNLNAMYNEAHKATYDANPDIFIGYEWSTTFDDRTSLTCMVLSGTFYPLGSNPPGPPAHWNCRSLLIGVFRDPELQSMMDKDTQRVKEYKADGTHEDAFISSRAEASAYLRRQPKQVQIDVLGSALKRDAFVNHGTKLNEMVDPLFQPYTDKALVRRMAALNAKSSFWRAEAAARGVRVPKATTIKAEDAALTREYDKLYEQPQPMPGTEGAPESPSTQYASAGSKKHDEWIESLTPEEKEGFASWTGQGFIDMKEYQADPEAYLERMRTADPRRRASMEATVRKTDAFRNALERAPRYDNEVHRGLSYIDQGTVDEFLNNNTLTLESDLSGTTSLANGRRYAWSDPRNSFDPDYEQGLMMTFRQRNTAVDLGRLGIEEEAEAALLRGNRYRLVDRQRIRVGLPGAPSSEQQEVWHLIYEEM